MNTLRARWLGLGCLVAILMSSTPSIEGQDQAGPLQNRQQRRQQGGRQNNGNSNSSQGNSNLGGITIPGLPFPLPTKNSNNNNKTGSNGNNNNGNNSNSQGGGGGSTGSGTNNNNNSGGAMTPEQKRQQQKDKEQGKVPPNPMPSSGTANNNNPGKGTGTGSSQNNSKDHNSTGHKIGGIVIDALTPKYGYGGYGRYGYPNQYYYDDYYSYTPTTPPPPANGPVVQPNVMKNVIVPQQGPLVRNAFKLPSFDKTAAAARTDAEQIARIGALKQQAGSVIQSAVSASGDPAMMSDWTAYQQSPSTAGLQGFKDKWGGKLGPQNDGLLGAALRASKYQDDLMTGQLTSSQKDQSISEIEGGIGASLPTGPANAGMKQDLDQMRKLNALGKIVEAAQIGINTFPAILQGAQSCGYPPSFVGQMVGVPYMDVPPMPDKAPAAAPGKTCLLNPENTGNVINYSLNEYPYSMGPGQSQYVDSGYVITFDNGSGVTKRYTLSDGSYRFAIGPQGWDMQSATFKVTLDNSNYGSDFNFSVNNEPGAVRAGQAVQVQSPYPVEIVFDRGDGGEPARKRLTDGIYLVGVDAGQQRLELFDVALLRQQQPQQQNAMMPMMQQGGVDPAEAQRRAALIQEQLRGRVPPGAMGAPNMSNTAPANNEDALRRLQGR